MLCNIGVIEGQPSDKIYKAIVKMTDGSTVKGWLYHVSEEGIYLQKGKTTNDNRSFFLDKTRIEKIKLIRKGERLLWAGIGSVAFASPLAIEQGVINKCQSVGCEGGTGLAVVGAGLFGAVAGSAIFPKRMKFEIDGKEALFARHLSNIKKYAYQKE